MTTSSVRANSILPAWLQGGQGVVSAAAILYAVLYVVWTLFHWGGEENASFIADLANIPISLLATVAALRVALKRQHDLKLRRAWFVLGLGLGASALGEVLWFYINSVLKVDAFPSIADLFYFSFYPLVLLGLVIFPNAPLSREARAKFWFDIAIVSTVAGMYIWNFILAPTLATAESGLLSQFLAGAYPVADLMVITGMMVLIFRRVDAATRGALLILSLGLLFFTSADLFFGYTSLFGEFTSGTLGDAGYVVSYALFGLAGLRQAYAGGGVDFRRGGWWDQLTAILPFVAILLGYGLAVFVYSATPELNGQLRGVFAGAILLALLITARQLVALRENEMLNGQLRTTADELRALSGDLEQRIASRTRDLALAAEISRSISQVRDLDSLLSEAVELIRSRFDLYYAQVYLTDAGGRTLVLRAGTGSTGAELLQRSHRLPVGPGSLNGRAAAEKQAIIVSDTTTSVSFRPNPLLPLTRSEMAMPLVVGDQVVGVLDLQHSQPGAFTAGALPAFEAVAGQLAVAIRNAALFTQAEQARAEVEAQARRLAQGGWADFLNAVERSERIGYAFDANGLAPLEASVTPVPAQPTLAAPILVSGEPVGLIQLEGNIDQGWTDDEAEVVNAVARQVAQQVENLRLLAQAERARAEVEAQARRLTREGWQNYLQTASPVAGGYTYDLNQVSPLIAEADPGASGVTQPLTVRDERMGEIEVEGGESLDSASAELVATVAGQLSAHIETLRLSEQTRAALAEAEQARRESERRATELAAINRVVAIAASSFNLQAILGATASEIVQVLKARNSGIALLDESRQNLTVIADHSISPDEVSSVGVVIPLANNPSSIQVIETRRSVVIANAQTNPLTEPIHALLRERQTQCLMIVPLLARGETIGTIGVDTTDPDRAFTSAEVALVETIAGQLAGAIENVHLFEEVERHATELRALFAAMTDVVLVYDKEGRYVRIAPTNPSLLYRPADDMIGKTLYEVMPKPKADELFAYIQQALETRQPVNAEYQLDIGETSLWFLATVTPLGEEKVFWIARDITQRKQAENVLAKHAVELQTVARVSTAASSVLQVEALLQEVVDLTRSSFNLYHAHIYLLNEPGDLLVLSAGAGNVGKKMVEIGRRISLNHERSLVARAARTRRGVVANDVTQEPDFLPNPLLPQTRSEMAVPMVVGDKLLGVFDVQSDIANRFTDDDLRIQMTLAGQVAVALQNARLYAEQTATVARLRELDQLKSSFLANMSHELRTPLNSILGFTEVLLEGIDGDLTDRMDNDLKVIYKNGQHLLTLINDILDMAKIEAGKMTLTTERFNLQEVLEEVVALATPLAQNKSLELRLETGFADYLEVEADRIRLRQVVINLVNNAIKFTETGWVSLNASRTEARVLISIRDTGVGIPPGQLETIFQEFHQVDSSTTRKAGGTGLGLPISRHLIELHNGRLWAESSGKPGLEGGATFFVELPAQSNYDPNAER